MTPLAFIDVETTGLDPDRHHIWEFAAVLADHDPQEHTLQVAEVLHVDLPVDLATADAAALRIGRFYERHATGTVAGATRLDPVMAAGRIARELAGRHLVGANPGFDAGFIDRLLRRHGYAPAWNYHLVDVSPLVAGYLQGVAAGQHASGKARRHDDLVDRAIPPYRSTDLADAIGVTVDKHDRHTAVGDAWWALHQYAAVFALDVEQEVDR